MENFSKKASEIKNPEFKQINLNAQDIKPETGLSFNDAKDFLLNKFSNLADMGKGKIEVTELNIEKAKTGWSPEIKNNIKNKDQLEKLNNAGVKEKKINGRDCLVKNNIDLNCKDEFGRSNKHRMSLGLAPIDKTTGQSLELHHLGQKNDSPLVELTGEEHRTGEYKDGKKNDSLWHDATKKSEINRDEFEKEKKEYWKERLNLMEGN